MKRLILLIFLFASVNLSFAQDESNFEDFKTGKFVYEGMEDDIEIIRTKKKQIEIYNNGKSKLILKIKWKNDSTYVLTMLKAINAPGCVQKGERITATIKRRMGNRYVCSYTSDNCGGGESVFIKVE